MTVRPLRLCLALAITAGAVAFGAGASAAPPAPDAAAEAGAEVRLVKVSQDPYENPDAYHQTQVEADTFAWGDTVVAGFQTGRFSNGGSTNIGFATSHDGGRTWTHGFLPHTTVAADPPGPYPRVSDPVVAYDDKHDVWLLNSLTVGAGNLLLVSRSRDDGLTWGRPVIASPEGKTSYDKNWIVCDNWPDSPHYGNCYIEADDTSLGNRMAMFTSTDGGRTWTEAVVPAATGLGGLPLAQPDGTVVVPYSGNLNNVQALVSEDGGETYDGPYFIETTNDRAVPFMRAPAIPSAEVDARGRIYVVWQDCRFREGCSSNDIVMSTSKNGRSWSDVSRVPIDPVGSTVDHFTPGLGVDPTRSGRRAKLALTYSYFPTDDCTLQTCRLFQGFVNSVDGGRHWSEPTRLAGPMRLEWLPDAGGRFVGDYVSTSFVGRRAITVFARATETICTVGEVGSCNEDMVAPKGGLAVHGGSIPMGRDAPVTGVESDHTPPVYPRAF